MPGKEFPGTLFSNKKVFLQAVIEERPAKESRNRWIYNAILRKAQLK